MLSFSLEKKKGERKLEFVKETMSHFCGYARGSCHRQTKQTHFAWANNIILSYPNPDDIIELDYYAQLVHLHTLHNFELIS